MPALAPYIPPKDADLNSWVANFSAAHHSEPAHLRPHQRRCGRHRGSRRDMGGRVCTGHQPDDKNSGNGEREEFSKGVHAGHRAAVRCKLSA